MPYKDHNKHLEHCKKYYHEHKHEARFRYNPVKHKENNRKHLLMTKYKITVHEYNNILEKQGGRCAICGKHKSEFTIALAVDHNHQTGKIRGLLCSKCNKAIGLMDDDIDRLKTTILYLEAK